MPERFIPAHGGYRSLRRVLPLVLGLLLLSGLLGFLSAKTTSLLRRPETYPAVGFDGAAFAPGPSSGLEKTLRAHPSIVRQTSSPDGLLTYSSVLRDTWIWRRVEAHPYLTTVLPGVELFSVEIGWFPERSSDQTWCEVFVAVRDSQCYVLPEDLNQFLYDGGMRFTNSDIGKWARICALLISADNRWRLPGQLEAYWTEPFLPGMTLQSLTIGDPDEYSLRTLTLKMLLGGQESATARIRAVFAGVPGGHSWFVPWILEGISPGKRFVRPLRDAARWHVTVQVPDTFALGTPLWARIELTYIGSGSSKTDLSVTSWDGSLPSGVARVLLYDSTGSPLPQRVYISDSYVHLKPARYVTVASGESRTAFSDATTWYGAIGPGRYYIRAVCTLFELDGITWVRITAQSQMKALEVIAPPDSIRKAYWMYEKAKELLDKNARLDQLAGRMKGMSLLRRIVTDYPHTPYGEAAADELLQELRRGIHYDYVVDTLAFLDETARLLLLYPDALMVSRSMAHLRRMTLSLGLQDRLLRQLSTAPAGADLAKEAGDWTARLERER